MNIFSPRRPLLVFAVALGVQLLLLAFQIRREHNIRLIRVWTVEAFTPVESAGTASLDWIGGVWKGYIGLYDAQRQNRRLQAEVDRLHLQVDQLSGQAAEAARLASLLGYRQAHKQMRLLPARVISASPALATRLIYIDRGAHDGVRANMAVITPEGVVGKILEVYPESSQVLLVTDRQSGVGALLSPTRTEGVVRGTGGPRLQMDFVQKDEKVSPGELVLTSGLDQVFPKDLPVGTVLSTRPGSPFQQIELRPAARLDRLEDVLVVLMRPKILAPPASADPPGRRHH